VALPFGLANLLDSAASIRLTLRFAQGEPFALENVLSELIDPSPSRPGVLVYVETPANRRKKMRAFLE
jgi:hypothetical protein